MPAWTLCSKQDVLELAPGMASELRDSWSIEVEALIRQYLGQPYLGQIVSVTDEYHNGDGTNILHASKPPIHTVTSIRVNGTTLLPSDYIVFPSYVQLIDMIFPRGSANILFSYESGSQDIDPTVRLAASSMIVSMLTYRRRSGADSSIKWGDIEQGAGEPSPNMNVGLTSHLNTIMKRLLRRPRLRVR